MDKGLVIFDFDGVIVDSLQMAYSINAQQQPGLEYREWQSWSEGNFYQRSGDGLESETDHAEFFRQYDRGLGDLPPIEGVAKAIKALASTHTLVIVSSSSEHCISRYLERYGLLSHFEDILGKETHKRKVDKLQSVIERYGVKASDVVMITDSIGDIREAQEVGTKTIAVTWGIHEEKRLKETGSDAIAKTPNEILTAVDALLSKIRQ